MDLLLHNRIQTISLHSITSPFGFGNHDLHRPVARGLAAGAGKESSMSGPQDSGRRSPVLSCRVPAQLTPPPGRALPGPGLSEPLAPADNAPLQPRSVMSLGPDKRSPRPLAITQPGPLAAPARCVEPPAWQAEDDRRGQARLRGRTEEAGPGRGR